MVEHLTSMYKVLDSIPSSVALNIQVPGSTCLKRDLPEYFNSDFIAPFVGES